MHRQVIYRYTGAEEMPWKGRKLVPGQFISLEDFHALNLISKALTISQVVEFDDLPEEDPVK